MGLYATTWHLGECSAKNQSLSQSVRLSIDISTAYRLQVREDPKLEATERTYTAAINCFQHYTPGMKVASLDSTMAGYEPPASDGHSIWTPKKTMARDKKSQLPPLESSDELF